MPTEETTFDVELLRGRELVSRNGKGVYSAYCELAYSNQLKVETKAPAVVGKYVTWNESFTFYDDDEDQFRIKVYDQDNYFVGGVYFNINDVVDKPTVFTVTNRANKPAGSVKVAVHFAPVVPEKTNAPVEEPAQAPQVLGEQAFPAAPAYPPPPRSYPFGGGPYHGGPPPRGDPFYGPAVQQQALMQQGYPYPQRPVPAPGPVSQQGQPPAPHGEAPSVQGQPLAPQGQPSTLQAAAPRPPLPYGGQPQPPAPYGGPQGQQPPVPYGAPQGQPGPYGGPQGQPRGPTRQPQPSPSLMGAQGQPNGGPQPYLQQGSVLAPGPRQQPIGQGRPGQTVGTQPVQVLRPRPEFPASALSDTNEQPPPPSGHPTDVLLSSGDESTHGKTKKTKKAKRKTKKNRSKQYDYDYREDSSVDLDDTSLSSSLSILEANMSRQYQEEAQQKVRGIIREAERGSKKQRKTRTHRKHHRHDHPRPAGQRSPRAEHRQPGRPLYADDGGVPHYLDGGGPHYLDGGVPHHLDEGGPRYLDGGGPRYRDGQNARGDVHAPAAHGGGVRVFEKPLSASPPPEPANTTVSPEPSPSPPVEASKVVYVERRDSGDGEVEARGKRARHRRSSPPSEFEDSASVYVSNNKKGLFYRKGHEFSDSN